VISGTYHIGDDQALSCITGFKSFLGAIPALMASHVDHLQVG
ncbi:uncharacterized protein METZ01_LOCUS120921, partial [marine metagenome]